MAKKSEMVRRIKDLQGKMNQAEFARYLGVPQSRVSEYLAGKRPTAEMCVRLAKLAPYPDNLWFLEQAGLKRDDILSVAGNIARDVFTPPQGTDLIRVSPSEDSPEALAAGDLALPNRLVANPAWTRYMVVSEEFLRPMILRSRDIKVPLDAVASKIFGFVEDEPLSYTWSLLGRGDILLLDVSQNSSLTLRPFWGLHLVVKTNYYTRYGGPSLLAGEVTAVASTRDVSARLCTHIGDDVQTLDVGIWVPPRATASAEKSEASEPNYPMESEKGKEFYARAKAEMQLEPGYTILGIIRGWLSARGAGR